MHICVRCRWIPSKRNYLITINNSYFLQCSCHIYQTIMPFVNKWTYLTYFGHRSYHKLNWKASTTQFKTEYMNLWHSGLITNRHWTKFGHIWEWGSSILKVFDSPDNILLGEQPVHFFTAHRELIFFFEPRALEPTIESHFISKVQLWAIFLSRFWS